MPATDSVTLTNQTSGVTLNITVAELTEAAGALDRASIGNFALADTALKLVTAAGILDGAIPKSAATWPY